MDSLSTSRTTQEMLKKHGFRTKKSLGQNFLIDDNILRNIVSAADVDKDTVVIEVGPGAGALTRHLAHTAKKVIAVEIDQRLKALLEDTLSPFDNIQLVFQDLLEMDIDAFVTEHVNSGDRIAVVANLPYYVTTPILMRFLTARVPIDTIVVMIQKEVAERMQAEPGEKSYGSLSIAVQYGATAKIVMNVPKTVFIPQPNVDSAVIRLDRLKDKKVNVRDVDFFFKVVRGAFAQRRKTLQNNLMHLFGKDKKPSILEALDKAEIEPGRRGETLTIEEFARLSEALLQLK